MEKMEQRKNQHIEYALSFHSEQNDDWDKIELPLTSFPELDFTQISIKTEVMGFSMSSPFYINAMTGGSLRAKELNRQLAVLARECDLMLAMGSYSIVLRLPEAKESFDVIRREAPDIILGVNLGADKNVEDAKRAVEMSGANFLQIHVNPLQEIIMPEGERNFRGWLDNVAEIIQNMKVPVMVKQVGFGMTREDIEKLIKIGVKTVDISGKGGTNFAKIENARRENPYPSLENLGMDTISSLQTAAAFQDKIEIIASGGIKNALQIAKALSMGARAVGIAGQILYLLEKDGLERTIAKVKAWQEELKILYLLCGVQNTKEINKKSLTN